MTEIFDLNLLDGAFFSLNANGAAMPNYGGFERLVREAQPRVTLVMENADLAKRVAFWVPNGIVVHRIYHATDTQFWRNFTPQQAFDWVWINGARPHARIWYDVNNEATAHAPNASKRDTLKAWIQWEIETARIFAANGMHYVTAIAVAKSIDKEFVEEGLYDPLIKAWEENPFFHCGVHDYGFGYPHAEHLPDYPENMSDPMIFTVEGLTRARIVKERVNGQLPDNWHLERIVWLIIRAIEIGSKPFEYVITEAWHDLMDDVAAQRTSWSNGKTLKELFKSISGTDPKGIPSLKPVWRWLQPTIDVDEQIRLQFEWAEREYSEWCIGICVFTWSSSSDWSSFAIQGEGAYHDVMKTIKRTGWGNSMDTGWPEIDLNDPRWKEAEISPSDTFFTLREQPYVSTETFRGYVYNTLTGRVLLENEWTGNGNTWIPIELAGAVRWIAKKFITVNLINDEPGEEYALDVAPFTVMMSQEERNRLEQWFVGVKSFMLINDESENVVAVIDILLNEIRDTA